MDEVEHAPASRRGRIVKAESSVTGIRIGIAARLPTPGNTPMTIPMTTPMTMNPRLDSVNAASKPAAS